MFLQLLFVQTAHPAVTYPVLDSHFIFFCSLANGSKCPPTRVFERVDIRLHVAKDLVLLDNRKGGLLSILFFRLCFRPECKKPADVDDLVRGNRSTVSEPTGLWPHTLFRLFHHKIRENKGRKNNPVAWCGLLPSIKAGLIVPTFVLESCTSRTRTRSLRYSVRTSSHNQCFC